MDFLHLLDHTTLFGELSERSKEMLAEIALPKHVEKGQTLFLERDKGHALYLVGTGRIRLTRSGGSGKDVVVKVAGAGEVFGEVVLFESDRYPVTATAVNKGIVFLFPKHQFHCLLDSQSFRNDFIVLLMHKQRYLIERLHQLQVQDIDKRLYSFLIQNYGTRARILPGMTKKEMAAAIGTTPETLSRLLLKLKKARKLEWTAQEIRVSDTFWKELAEK